MCLPACLWAQIARNPITELGRFLQNAMTINFRDWFISFQHKEKNYRIASMFITTRVSVSPPRNVERRESGSMFCEAIETISWSSNESSRKHQNIALKNQIMKFTYPAVRLTPFYHFSVCFLERLCFSLARCSPLDILLFTYAFSCSLSRSSRLTLPILVSSPTFLCVEDINWYITESSWW